MEKLGEDGKICRRSKNTGTRSVEALEVLGGAHYIVVGKETSMGKISTIWTWGY